MSEFFTKLYQFPELIRWGGYAALVAIVFAETGLLAGFFLPGDSLLVTAGLLAAAESHPGLIYTSDRRFPRHDPRTVGRLVTALHAVLSRDLDLTNLEHWLS